MIANIGGYLRQTASRAIAGAVHRSRSAFGPRYFYIASKERHRTTHVDQQGRHVVLVPMRRRIDNPERVSKYSPGRGQP